MKSSTRIEKGTLIVDVVGQIDIGSSPALRKTLLDSLKATNSVAINLSAVKYIDSSGIASLLEVFKEARNSQRRFVMFGLTGAVLQVLQLTRLTGIFEICETEEQAVNAWDRTFRIISLICLWEHRWDNSPDGKLATLKVGAKVAALLGLVGFWTISGFAYIGDLANLAGRSAYFTFIGPFQGRPFRPARVLSQAMAIGVEAIPIVSLITFFVGLIMALQSAYQLRQLGAMQLVAAAVAISILRELGPLLTAIVVIGRSGSAFAAEIGTKKVTEEVDALRTMAFDPVAFLVAPKFLAMLVMMPCLAVWADFMGIVGGCVFGVTAANFTIGSYFQATKESIVTRDIYTGLIKSVLFGLVITAVGCKEGFSTGAGAEEVGRSTTSAVVTSIALVICVDLVFTTLFYLINPT